MSKLPTAEELILKKYSIKKLRDIALYGDIVVEFAKEFAKLHVEAALKAAVDNIQYYSEPYDDTNEKYVDEKSILNAYPLTNIK